MSLNTARFKNCVNNKSQAGYQAGNPIVDYHEQDYQSRADYPGKQALLQGISPQSSPYVPALNYCQRDIQGTRVQLYR